MIRNGVIFRMEYEKNIRGVIFDIDGVLLDSLSIWSDLAGRYLRSQEKEPEPGLYEIIFSMSMEESAAYMSEHYGLGLSPEDVVMGLENMLRDFYYNEVEAKTGALELMRFLKKKISLWWRQHPVPEIMLSMRLRERASSHIYPGYSPMPKWVPVRVLLRSTILQLNIWE